MNAPGCLWLSLSVVCWESQVSLGSLGPRVTSTNQSRAEDRLTNYTPAVQRKEDARDIKTSEGSSLPHSLFIVFLIEGISVSFNPSEALLPGSPSPAVCGFSARELSPLHLFVLPLCFQYCTIYTKGRQERIMRKSTVWSRKVFWIQVSQILLEERMNCIKVCYCLSLSIGRFTEGQGSMTWWRK